MWTNNFHTLVAASEEPIYDRRFNILASSMLWSTQNRQQLRGRTDLYQRCCANIAAWQL